MANPYRSFDWPETMYGTLYPVLIAGTHIWVCLPNMPLTCCRSLSERR